MNNVYVYAMKQESIILTDIVNNKQIIGFNVSVRIGEDDRLVDLSEPFTRDGDNLVYISCEELLRDMRKLLNGDSDQPVKVVSNTGSSLMISKLDEDKFVVSASFPSENEGENSNGIGVVIDTNHFTTLIGNIEEAYRYTGCLDEEENEGEKEEG